MRSFLVSPLASAIGAACAAAVALPLLLPGSAVAQPAEAGARAGGTQSLALRPLDFETRSGGDPGGGSPEPVEPLGTRGLPATDTDPFSLLGVVWDDPSDELNGTVQVRARDAATGDWSDWLALEPGADHAPDPGTAEAGADHVRGGTAPRWVGASDGVHVRVEPGGGARAAELPDGLSVELIDPGVGEADGELAGEVAPGGGAAAGDHEGPRPPIVIRSQWGADEGLRESGFVYTDSVKTAFVHHTAGGNNYACSEAPSLLRGIYRYHVESQGWRDVGYNFFVDKCGTIYEGRAGGVALPVQGAHTYGFNHNSMGVAVLGTYSSTDPGRDVRDALSLLTAWKLGLHDRDPAASANRTSGGGKYPVGTTVKLNNISGHRDGYATECPGDALYDDLPTIRDTAHRLQGR
ncbi:peptidoglycan recognition protein [Streptomyces radicis]|uniref:N-acetylmuramoyl-L-alanine amidase n=1 Tax=Streptomyces radicis TaxID=1750517 RepID=A0A3A9W6A8_9ACTN|nr:N-acetylmuramoyl-L-alanine amidase [Streptomyces radicis]RKN08741.1 N-acetylmuramoyl-L-alanine amidase [Streptomyces radicis]RKN21899.1 N-acetylmuramoyl-L-alanine amidase [Streptomyces radicis]